MRLWVLAHELAGHALFAADHVRDALTDLVRQHVGGFRPDPSAVADRLGSLDAEARRSDGRAAAGARRPRGAARRGDVARAAGAAAAPRRPRRRRRRLHRLDRRRRRRARRRRQRPAHRRGRAPPAGRDHRPATRSSSSCSASASATTRSPGARRSCRASSTAPATTAWPRCSSVPTPSRRRTRSTRPACGSPASSDAHAVRRPSGRGGGNGRRARAGAAGICGRGSRAAAAAGRRAGAGDVVERRRPRRPARRPGTRPSRGSR